MNESLEDLIGSQAYLYKGGGFSQNLPSGIITLDLALAGGIPLNGSIIEVYGEESHGKTTLSYRICKKCTDTTDGYVTWIDSEVSYDEEWASVQGVNTEKVLAYRPPYAEACMDTIIEDIKRYKSKYLPWLIDPKWKPSAKDAERAGVGVTNVESIKANMTNIAPPHMIVWDSLAASPVKSVAEENSDYASGMAYRARLIKSFLSRYQVAVIGCDKIGMILINQVIDDIGSYGGGITTPGGRGLRHGKHLAIYVKKSGSGEKDAENFKVTDYVMIALTKNKVTPVVASFPVIFSKSRGFLGATSVLEYLWNTQWFRSAGSWKKFDYETVNPETGEITTEEISIQRGTFYELMEKRPELFRYLCQQIKDQLVSKFPSSRSLRDSDIDAIIDACLTEDSAVPDEEEIESLS